ncbi:dTDP-4-dehydrorhamnose reductase [Pseudomonas matsuisoli]|uniref:dTDP-4-dehydrorhamnose reductase n=1 Tax=Pseudomonas matsuisoli TaxID=1515666 RepID=A0A917Q2R3_9PSED|nr:dTDP-4-dehydrorhamnose reductase [Pseudomonas matsuisoli]GGK09254.1 NAD(P)-dependent oxidoreductase [Pseudomonas matsuisoli]
MNRILLLGANGQVGWELQRSLAPLGELVACARADADFERPAQLEQIVMRVAPDIIVNAAAYTAVDKAESDKAAARQVNALSVGLLADLAAQRDAWLVHYSTDYVFDGSADRPYLETDATQPMSVYGQTKLEGEQAITASGCRHVIFRTSWVYAARGNNFAKTMLRLAGEQDVLKVVVDQIGAPTSAELIADVTALALHRICHDDALAKQLSGIYHLVAAGEVSWHAYAQYIIGRAEQQGRAFNVPANRVEAITSADYPTPARRPANSGLDTTKLQRTFGLRLPAWQTHANRMLKELL